MFALTGYSLEDEKQNLIQSLRTHSPIRYVDSTAVHTLIIHGTFDKVVSLRQSQNLKKLLEINNIPSKLITVNKGDHGLK